MDEMTKKGTTKGTQERRARATVTAGQSALMGPPANPIPPSARSNRASKEEVQLRVGYVVQMLLDGRRKHEIKQFFRSQYGIGARQVERLLCLARARLAEANGTDVDQMRAEFYQRYIRLFRESENDAIKISALRAAGDLYGLNAPQKVAQTTSGGKDVHFIRETVKGLTVDELRVLKKARARLVAAK
jgi:hypothetical protein